MKKVIAILLTLVTIISICSIGVSAVSYNGNYGNYDEPESNGDYAQWNGSKMVKSSSTTTSEVKWMQAALNYCKKNRGISFSDYLEIDGNFGPASKKATVAFQKAYKLTDDGSFGPATIKKMKDVLKSTNPTPTPTPSNSKWMWPSPEKRTSCGFADNVYHTEHWHRGIDIPCSNKTDVYASKAGKIACVSSDNSRGKYIVIDHGDGYYSEYQHLNSISKSKGDKVNQGDIIAKSGNTGSGGYHLHFEIWNLGKSGKTINNANTPWSSYSQYVNVNPKNKDKIYCSKSNSSFKIGQKQGNGIPKANLTKTSTSAGSGFVYCYDSNGIDYTFKK